MADNAKPTIDLLLATKLVVERDLKLGLVTEDQLRFTIAARKEFAKELNAKGYNQQQIADLTGVSQATISGDLSESNKPKSKNDSNYNEGLSEDDKLEQARKREEALREQLRIAQSPVEAPQQRYGTIVIDPPWPMKKIEREVRPNQVEFDYPTMEYDQLRAFRSKFQPLAAEDCHVFMWTTQKFLPMALRLFEDYDVTYVLTMVWHKAGGFQPVGLPQYNCEFVLYGRSS